MVNCLSGACKQPGGLVCFAGFTPVAEVFHVPLELSPVETLMEVAKCLGDSKMSRPGCAMHVLEYLGLQALGDHLFSPDAGSFHTRCRTPGTGAEAQNWNAALWWLRRTLTLSPTEAAAVPPPTASPAVGTDPAPPVTSTLHTTQTGSGISFYFQADIQIYKSKEITTYEV